MTDHNEALRLADSIHEMNNAAYMTAIANLTAERDTLLAEVERLHSAVRAFCDATSWSAQSWKDQPYIKPLFDLARTTHKETE